MAKTALELTREAWHQYQPDRVHKPPLKDRIERAFRVARTAADILRHQFQADRVYLFGSLAAEHSFTAWSDIDLAVSGIEPTRFYRAVAAVTGFNSEFKIDLVDLDDCGPDFRTAIQTQGVRL